MIKAAFFDLDGVLTTDFNATDRICRNLCDAVPGLKIETATECYRQHCRHLLVERRKHADVWEKFCACAGREISSAILQEALRSVSKNEAMFSLVGDLHKNYRLGIITDNSEERMELLNGELQLPALFDPIVVSSSVHALKHDGTTTIFDAALEAVQCEPQEAIFVDNQERNLVTPAAMGMKTYWHDDKRNDIAALLFALREWNVVVEGRV
ncbi:MAG: HAD hydrolase-like protein [Candidatus Peregrinibacteria bacterium]|nr:HAD hydrolase-like protein [Candidatus Peregrinibacteria bacterium]